MHAMILERPRSALVETKRPRPQSGPGRMPVSVSACRVCRNDLHVVDGDLTESKMPIVPGYEIVNRVVVSGKGVEHFAEDRRVGILWLGWSYEQCKYCRTSQEYLYDKALDALHHGMLRKVVVLIPQGQGE